jgi:ribosome-binding factor A
VKRDNPRARRVGEQIQRELSELIRLDLDDPQVGMITLTDVEVAADLGHAKVFFTVLADPSLDPAGAAEAKQASLAGLQRAAGFLRAQLGHRLLLRSVPQLHFVYDESIERGVHLSQLIDRAIDSESRG